MVISVPAVVLGLIFVFLVGAGIALIILELISKTKKKNPTIYRDTLKPVEPDYLSEKDKNTIAVIGGGVAVILVFVLMFIVPKWAIAIYYGLVAIGILVGISTFFLFGNGSSLKADTQYQDRLTGTQARQKTKKERSKDQNECNGRVYKARRGQQESKREHKKHQTEYQFSLFEIQRKHAEILAIRRDWYSLFSIPDNQSRKRGELLGEVLNRFFKANDIYLKEAFEFIGQGSEGNVERVEGAIEISEHSFLVEIIWKNEPLGIPEVSSHLARVFGRGYSGGVLVSSSEFSQPVVTTCKDALFQKTVILCGLDEIAILLEQDGSAKDFLKAKIVAAVEDKNPLVKPLFSQDSGRQKSI